MFFTTLKENQHYAIHQDVTQKFAKFEKSVEKACKEGVGSYLRTLNFHQAKTKKKMHISGILVWL